MHRELYYKVGYTYYPDSKNDITKGWHYRKSDIADLTFKDTSAHELGHEILKSYSGTEYSYGHKGSSEVYSFDQHTKNDALELPMNGEIDLMPYYNSNVLGDEHKQPNYFLRRIAAEKDVLSLLWLTKIEIL
ncbi:hypothetical protein [Chryseobacterium sp. ERMR1:04]|uniref:hypothetical protein n=1 Tax=Chryseobacterium sp. ERMR1:04 TaxID=1705393 RepID=UPI0006C8C524|nr:hypothetical protein [Chryseobacterium sp. ERMR1:04]KPH13086.1 hypothetical protein AMQ68_11375 [Chryseobacterium sp. ERMR1:04]